MTQIEIIEEKGSKIISSVNRWLKDNRHYMIINISLAVHSYMDAIYYLALITYKT